MNPDSDPVTVGVLKAELRHQGEMIALELQHLGEKLEGQGVTADARHADHEDRLRAIEKKTTWTRIIEGGLGLAAGFAAWMGWRQS